MSNTYFFNEYGSNWNSKMSLLISYKTSNRHESDCTSNKNKFFYKHAKLSKKLFTYTDK